MRLIIKEYLTQLKEKDELDLLLCDLLLELGYITDNKPETGNRQYGVDIQAHNSKEILLCVVKQGNIDRRTWSGDQNAVRQSLCEIEDVYYPQLTTREKKKKIHIVVAANGTMSEAVKLNWEGYVERNKKWGTSNVVIEFWNIDTIVDEIQKNLLNEFLFNTQMQSSLRKALYYVEEQDYKNDYFETIVDCYIERFTECNNRKQFRKEASSLYLATQMISEYASYYERYKISIMVCEYVIIRYWSFLLENNYFEKNQYLEWLVLFCKCYEKWNDIYVSKIEKCCVDRNAFPRYNIVEQRVMLYEVMGYLASYSCYLLDQNDLPEAKKHKQKSSEISNLIIRLINNYQQIYYPPYDDNIGVINMVFRLLTEEKRNEELQNLLVNYCTRLMYEFRFSHKYPSPTDSFYEAANMEFNNNEVNDYTTSGMWGMLLEWVALLDDKELYVLLQDFLNHDLGGVTKCLWFLRKEEEKLFYSKDAMHTSGEGVAISADKEYQEFIKDANAIFKQYEKEKFSYEEYSFPGLEMIVCRYYGYIPRAKVLFE